MHITRVAPYSSRDWLYPSGRLRPLNLRLRPLNLLLGCRDDRRRADPRPPESPRSARDPGPHPPMPRRGLFLPAHAAAQALAHTRAPKVEDGVRLSAKRLANALEPLTNPPSN